MWKWCLSSDFSNSQLLPKSFGGRLMWRRPTNDKSGLHVYGGDEGRNYIRKKELWEMDRRFYQRNHYSNLDQLCNHFHCYSRNSQGLNYLLRSIFVLLIHSLNHLQLLLHSLKPNSSTHPLQIYCIGFTGLEFIYPLGIVHKPSPYNWCRLWEELMY